MLAIIINKKTNALCCFFGSINKKWPNESVVKHLCEVEGTIRPCKDGLLANTSLPSF